MEPDTKVMMKVIPFQQIVCPVIKKTAKLVLDLLLNAYSYFCLLSMVAVSIIVNRITSDTCITKKNRRKDMAKGFKQKKSSSTIYLIHNAQKVK